MNSEDASSWSEGSLPLLKPEDLVELVAAATDITLVVSREGEILSVTTADEDSFGNLDSWTGRPVEDVLTVESVAKFEGVMERFTSGAPVSRPVELNHSDDGGWEFPIRYTCHVPASGGVLFMLGRDLRPVAETQQQLVQAQISLEQGYEARREYDARYRLLLQTVQDAIVFVSVSEGRIRDLNEAAAGLLGVARSDLLGAAFATEFRRRKKEELTETLLNAAIAETPGGVDLTPVRGRSQVTVVPRVFRVTGERILICRLKAREQPRGEAGDIGRNLRDLYDTGAEAIVFTTPNGVITECNNAFLGLVDAVSLSEIRGRNLEDHLSRGHVDMSVLADNAQRYGQMRIYATRILGEGGRWTAVELSVTHLDDRDSPELGFVIRDASRADAVRMPAVQDTEDSKRDVMELVGATSLKEIVSETTDVVEKMCIETAISLTKNNRVAAAEMLGLSRQSLYVKLRKYGLLNRDFGEDQD